jgi:N-methylhydantoinase A/oxoprolinase/acetone carboxylase beta subunit
VGVDIGGTFTDFVLVDGRRVVDIKPLLGRAPWGAWKCARRRYDDAN